jgi:hypothetical protein
MLRIAPFGRMLDLLEEVGRQHMRVLHHAFERVHRG